MNKTDLIDAMSADAGISKAAAKKALESFLGSVGGTLKKGGRVSSRFRILVSSQKSST